jgi:hypothetical protein
MTPPRDACEEKTTLLYAYEECASSYARAVTRKEYDAAYDRTEALRLECAAAQETLNRHVAAHGC